jgi:uncharacterized protein YbjT (DUF2867 family)
VEAAVVIMVVGGNGQLGAACCEEFRRRGHDVRATVRDPRRAGHLEGSGVEIVLLDVTDAARRRGALEGVDVLILTANAVAPRAGDDPAAFDSGLSALVDEAVSAGVGVFVLPSVPPSVLDEQVPPMLAKRKLEDQLVRGPAVSWVLRLPPFMEAWFALAGSSLPLRGEPNATVGRPSPFLRRFRSVTGSLVEDRGLMLVPGPPSNRHAFISVRDAARACVEAALRGAPSPAAPLEVGGPEILSWQQVADLYSEVLRRPVRVLSTPAPVYRTAARLLAPIAPVPSQTMAMNLYMAGTESAYSSAGGGLIDPATMTTAAEFLKGKAAMPARAIAVP